MGILLYLQHFFYEIRGKRADAVITAVYGHPQHKRHHKRVAGLCWMRWGMEEGLEYAHRYAHALNQTPVFCEAIAWLSHGLSLRKNVF